MDTTLDPQDTHVGPSAVSLESSSIHVNCVGQTKSCVPKQFGIRSFVCSDRIDISPTKVNSLPDVNLRSNQTHLGQPCDRKSPRLVSCPPNANVNPRLNQTHPSQLCCLSNVNRQSVVNKVNSQPIVNKRLCQTHLDQLRDHRLPKPTGCLLVYPSETKPYTSNCSAMMK